MTQKELERLCDEWQGRLRLRDWNVRVKIAEPELVGGCAHCGTTSARKLATIRIADPTAMQRDGDADRDTEADLVHELLHLHFDPFIASDTTSPVGVAQEQAIDLIANALVALKREAKSNK